MPLGNLIHIGRHKWETDGKHKQVVSWCRHPPPHLPTLPPSATDSPCCGYFCKKRCVLERLLRLLQQRKGNTYACKIGCDHFCRGGVRWKQPIHRSYQLNCRPHHPGTLLSSSIAQHPSHWFFELYTFSYFALAWSCFIAASATCWRPFWLDVHRIFAIAGPAFASATLISCVGVPKGDVRIAARSLGEIAPEQQRRGTTQRDYI